MALKITKKEAANWGVGGFHPNKLTSKVQRAAQAKELVQVCLEIVLTVPVEVKSDQNSKASHWAVRHRMRKRQREQLSGHIIELGLNGVLRPPPAGMIWRIVLTRLGCRSKMDAQDNLPMAFKAIVDEIANWLKIDDGETDKVVWLYDQVPDGKPGIRVCFQLSAKGS